MSAGITVGVIGVGRMGAPIARNLLDRGFPVIVTRHRHGERVAALVAKGAVEAETVEDLSARADVVLLVVPGSEEVESLLVAPGAVSSAVRAGTVVVDMTTNHPGVVARCGAALAARGVALIDAPMTRGVPAAEAGTLLLQVGGDAGALARVRPVLDAVAQAVVHVGPLGAGMVAKIVNNLKALSELPLIEEAFRLGLRLGLDAASLAALFEAGSADSFMVRTHVPRILRREPTVFATIDTVLKDLDLALGLAATVDVSLPMTAQARALYGAARDSGFGQADLTAAVPVLAADFRTAEPRR
jgi:3-hydroxyisobutyrate dehydrogenase-like beta-hydroxyacid dehydrogenase